MTALIWAATKGHLDVVKTLLVSGMDPNQADNRGYTPLFWALEATLDKDNQSLDVVKTLLANDANPFLQATSPNTWLLMGATIVEFTNSDDKIRWSGRPFIEDETPLNWTRIESELPITRTLLAYGAGMGVDFAAASDRPLAQT